MKVFVHGVPETAALWDKVRAELDEASVAVSLPGFGCPRPDGFAATKEAYLAWLLDELAAIDEPVDLVGHDWGAGLTYRVATAHADRIRSWVLDVANVAHPNYQWHDFARLWQTPEAGEAFFADRLASPPAAAGQVFESMGVGHDDAVTMASWTDETMAGCILALYRSATPNIHHDWPNRRSPAPGLVLVPSDDPFGDEAQAREVAAALGADVEVLDGLGHWWPLEDPVRGAEALRRFWSSL